MGLLRIVIHLRLSSTDELSGAAAASLQDKSELWSLGVGEARIPGKGCFEVSVCLCVSKCEN